MPGNCAIIVAAGKGKRMGLDFNKQFIDLEGKPVLFHTIRAFQISPVIDSIIIVAAQNERKYIENQIVKKYSLKKVIKIVAGGKRRQDSVYSGLVQAKGSEIVLIHDGARPFVDETMIEDGIRFARLYGASAPGTFPKDTIKKIGKDNFSDGTINRSELFCIQTPQCFKYDIIMDCHNKLSNDNVEITDDTSAVEMYGHKVYLYNGSYSNIKITTPSDIVLAKMIFESVNNSYKDIRKNVQEY